MTIEEKKLREEKEKVIHLGRGKKRRGRITINKKNIREAQRRKRKKISSGKREEEEEE